jgi:hypothetical protein
MLLKCQFSFIHESRASLVLGWVTLSRKPHAWHVRSACSWLRQMGAFEDRFVGMYHASRTYLEGRKVS